MKIPFKKYYFGKDAKAKLISGVDKLADSVCHTLGARGKNVIYESTVFQKPVVTNDGVTIAREGNLKDAAENQGMQLVKQASFRTNETAGDGTTSAIVVSRAIVKKGFELIEKGNGNAMEVEKALKKLSAQCVEELKAQAKKVDTEEKAIQIATVSCRDKELGEMIGKLMFKLGENPAVTLTEGLKHGVEIESMNGLRFDSPIKEGIITNQNKFELEMRGNVKVLISLDPIEDFGQQFFPLINQFAEVGLDGSIVRTNAEKLIIIAPKLGASIMQFLFQNSIVNGGALVWAWVEPSSFGEKQKNLLKDLALCTGAKVVNKVEGIYLKDLNLEDLGTAEAVITNKQHTIFVTGDANTDNILDHVNSLKQARTNSDSEIEQKALSDRIALLSGGVATIKIGAPTDVERKELHYRVEDAVNAVKSSIETGYLPGGGVALFNAINALRNSIKPPQKSGLLTTLFNAINTLCNLIKPSAKTDEDIALEILDYACSMPLKQILLNAGYSDDKVTSVLHKIKSQQGFGVNVLTDQVVDMVKEGVIDPLKVVYQVLTNAISVSTKVITCECLIVNEEEEEKAKA